MPTRGAAMTGAPGLRVLGDRAGRGLGRGRARSPGRARRARRRPRVPGEEVDVVAGLDEVGRLGQAHAAGAAARRRGRSSPAAWGRPSARGRVSETWRRSESTPKEATRAAAAHVAAQALLQRARQPARVGGQDDAAVVLQPRAAAGGERHVGGDVVAVPAAVQPRQQRRVARGEVGGQPVAGVDAERAWRRRRGRAGSAGRRRRRRASCGPARS